MEGPKEICECPFCGGEGEFTYADYWNATGYVYCKSCQCQTPEVYGWKDLPGGRRVHQDIRKEAIRLWNSRVVTQRQLDELAAYKATGVSPQALQEAVDSIPGALDLCSILRSELDRLREETKCLENNYLVLNRDINRLQSKKNKAEDLVAAMKMDLLLAASGHCCGICAKKRRCADVAQVTCCSAFRYYKMEE